MTNVGIHTTNVGVYIMNIGVYFCGHNRLDRNNKGTGLL
jgi:hypothetical protein